MIEKEKREYIMADIRLQNRGTTVTNVPNRFIDEYMAQANGDYVKIYLYLLRLQNIPGCDVSISMLADRLDYTERDIRRALDYWQRQHLLVAEYDSNLELVTICLTDQSSMGLPPMPQQVVPTYHAAASAPTVAAAVPANPIPPKRSFTPDETKRLSADDSVQDLIFVSSQYLGRTLNQSELDTIFYWYDSLHFSIELIEYLIESCIGKGHTSFHYMNKIAIAWAQSSISTVEEAKQRSAAYSKEVYGVQRAFGINNRNLVDYEITYIKKWTETYAFSMDIITEACRRTLQSTQKASFEYADTILTKWYQNDVHHMADIVKLDAAHQKSRASSGHEYKKPAPAKNKFNNFPQRTYDNDALERQLLENGIH